MLPAGTALARPTGAAGQSVDAARLAVDLTAGDGSAAVRVEYELTIGGAREVTVELLAPEGVSARDVRTSAGETVELRAAGGLLRRATVPLPPPGAPRAPTRLELAYRLDGAVRADRGGVRARVPVLSVALPPAAGGEVFRASVRVPSAWSVSEAFPAGLRETAPGVWEAGLPVVPSLVSVRGRSDGRWRPGPGLIVELATAAILLAFLALGWRRLRGVSR